MSFSSLEFIFLFLPIFLVIYYIFPKNMKNLILVIFSLIFYAIGVKSNPEYFILILLSTLINYILGILIEDNKKYSKYILSFGIVYDIGWLFIFKYFDFFSKSIGSITSTQPIILNLVLPLGISFYTFQVVSYLVDVYKGKYNCRRSIIDFLTYVLMFPKLISGPITPYDKLDEYINNKKTNTIENVSYGIKIFILGLAYKVLIANRVGSLWTDINTIGFDSISTPLAWAGVIAYSLQLYFDFYGYSLMAIGVGHMINLKLPINFDYPYTSVSMTEFWRRWHITLGNWFKEYVYFPLGGNRKGKLLTIRNMLVVWLLTGLWHGADWHFVLWGLSLFIIITIEKLFLKKYLDKYRWLGHIYMIILIPLSWTLFASESLPSLMVLLSKLFGINNYMTLNFNYLEYLRKYGLLLVIGILFSTKLPSKIYEHNKYKILEIFFIIVIFWLSVFCLCIEANDPFMYFNF